jgi:hypothetical protein
MTKLNFLSAGLIAATTLATPATARESQEALVPGHTPLVFISTAPRRGLDPTSRFIRTPSGGFVSATLHLVTPGRYRKKGRSRSGNHPGLA